MPNAIFGLLFSQAILRSPNTFTSCLSESQFSTNVVGFATHSHFCTSNTSTRVFWIEVTWFYVEGDEMLRFSALAIGICSATTFFFVGGPQVCDAQVREVRRILMSDIGYAKMDRRGNTTIAINSRMCRRLGPELCSFFRNHEYAHVQLRHFNRNISVQQAEAEADCFAARNSSPQAVLAAQRYFAGGRGGTRMHGTSDQRAARVASCGNRYPRRR